MEVWNHGIKKYRSIEAWKHGKMNAWMLGCLEALMHGDMVTRKGRSIEA